MYPQLTERLEQGRERQEGVECWVDGGRSRLVYGNEAAVVCESDECVKKRSVLFLTVPGPKGVWWTKKK